MSPKPPTLRRSLTRIAALATGMVTAGALLTVAAPASGAAIPKRAHSYGAAIEPMADYVGQVSCDVKARPGTKRLARLLAATYPVATSWNVTRTCDGSRSEHHDGRAIDWMASVRNKGQRTAAKTFIKWLLASDSSGNRFAMARRLGVMYVIYDNKMWGGWGGQWEEYNGCSKTKSRSLDDYCHRSHVHISLGWNGAMGRTSFWTGKVAATDYGPCRSAGMNWAGRYTKANHNGCAQVARAKTPKGSSKTKKALVKWSGVAARKNWRGPYVTAVQRALHVPATGKYSGSTVTAVRRFQARKHLSQSGKMNVATWRALLAATK